MNRRILIVAAASAAVILLVGIQVSRMIVRGSRRAASGSGVSLASLLNEARGLEQKNSAPEAMAAYQKLISEFPDSPDVMNWQQKSEELNMKLLFSPALTPQSLLYEVRPGDSLIKIAKEYNTTPELIMRMNNLSDSKIIPGRKLKVWNAPFNIYVDKSQNTLILKSGENIIKTYVVSTGKNNSSPVGAFKIVNKLTNPTWFKAGAVVPSSSPENVLGTRWMGFDLAGFGIHGTIEPERLGQQVTEGCVRMANPEVEELYTIVPVGTEVVIVD